MGRIWMRRGIPTWLGAVPLALPLVLAATPAHAIPNCDVPSPPPICGGETSPPPSSNHPPFGHWDSLTFPTLGGARYQGWAVDPDTPASSVRIEVSVSTDWPNVWTHQGFVANAYRPDVAAVYPWAGNYHGFDALTSKVAGTRQTCVDMFDTTTGARTSLGCRWYTISF